MINLAILFLVTSHSPASAPDNITALYLPSHCFTERKIEEFVHYAKLAGINAAVLHVKDPHGRIRWKSKNLQAAAVGAVASTGLVESTLRQLKAQGFWTVAKLDVFADHQLVTKRPDLGIIDIQSEDPWSDKKGLYWSNPFNQKVWEYNLALCKELVMLGFDEIQFDYIRFPSDGDLSAIQYPLKTGQLNKTQCIGKFLESAHTQLKPMGATISVDLFGMVAWKTVDFGVGQVIETIAPYVDVICPMLYPSHFPSGFLGKKKPGEHPQEIMELSMLRMKSRTGKIIRPWVQGFWYNPGDINAQLDGISESGTSGWSVWNPSGNYSTTYRALAARLNQTFPAPQFYPPVTQIIQNDERVIPGNHRVVNFTNYKQGYSIVSLEESKNGRKSAYSTLIQVMETLDEGIMDQILATREIPVSRLTCKYNKKVRLAELLCMDLQIDPRRLRPQTIYIDWQNGCRFSQTIPEDRLINYRIAGEAVFARDQDIYAILSKHL
ncbi:MAG: putative glycoside hydrolase [Desulfobacterales bacterium]